MPPEVAARYGSLIDRFQALSRASDWTPAVATLAEADELGKPYRVGTTPKKEETPPQAQWTTTPKEAIRDSAKPIVLSLTPDVCKTPVGSSIPPIPYSVYALPGEDEKTTPSVFFTGERAFVLRSNTTCTHGDEPGSAKGIKSGTVGDIAEPLDHSRTVRAEGQPVIRNEDRFYMNRGNTFGEVRMAGDNTTHGGNGADTRGTGERFADGFSENAGETWEGAKKVGSDALEGAKSIASDLWNDPLGTLGSAGESVAGGVTGAAQWTGEVGQNLWNDPGGTLGRGWENTQNTAGAVWHGVSDPYVQAYDKGGLAQALGHGTFDVVRLGVEALATKGAITVAGKAATVAGVARKVGAAEGAAAGVAEDVVPAARKAEQTAEEIERATPDENVRVTRPRMRVACFDMPPGLDPAEYDRQLQEQMATINNMTADDMSYAHWVLDKAGGTQPLRDPNAQVRHRTAYRRMLEKQGWSREDVSRHMEGLHATHFLDMIAGGNPTVFSTDAAGNPVLGAGDVNSDIGNRWTKGGRAASLREEAERMRREGRAAEKMSVELKRCK
jgi:hypothetical protein